MSLRGRVKKVVSVIEEFKCFFQETMKLSGAITPLTGDSDPFGLSRIGDQFKRTKDMSNSSNSLSLMVSEEYQWQKILSQRATAV